MEEELNKRELEEQMYALIHYVDHTQVNVDTNPKEAFTFENAPESNIRRYWRPSGDINTKYKKVNTPKPPVTHNATDKSQNKSYNEEKDKPSSSPDLSMFQQPVSINLKKTIEILETEVENRVVELVSSDEDEVIEVALPPKPTITIESSDEDDNCTAVADSLEIKSPIKSPQDKPTAERDITSPVPSVVSSVSDEFIRGDCIALNISSKHQNKQSFDFSLHGSDLLDQTPSKKRKKKKNKEATSTPISTPESNTSAISLEECFATPKIKAKNKRQRTKSYQVSEKSIPNADVYDSDSNQSITESSKYPNPFSKTDKTLPNTEVYESDSNQAGVPKESQDSASKNFENSSNSSGIHPQEETPMTSKKNSNEPIKSVLVDLTEPNILNDTIDENIVMGNLTGFSESDNYSDENTNPQRGVSKCGSTKIPAILNANLDFDNLKGKEKVCKNRRYSLTTLRAEMEKFYNESWGGEDFNHREIQKNMSRDKNLWVIDPKDRMTTLPRKKSICNYCNRAGHRDDTCRMKPAICYMCGSTGHFEPRCPRKICVNCGSPNHMYSTMCHNCSNWNYIKCIECGQNGHPASHCPDLWRRYHNTVNLDSALEQNRQLKKHFQMFCSGCTRRGHLVHTCRVTIPFSGLPIYSPYVATYRPVYSAVSNEPTQNKNNQRNKKNKSVTDNSILSETQRNEQLKRHSKSPVVHEMHQNKKRNIETETQVTEVNKCSNTNNTQRKEQSDITKDPEPINDANNVSETQDPGQAPDFIPIFSDNRDKMGQIIQDDEVSDTSEVITSARIYITKEIIDRLQSEESKIWLTDTLNKNNVTLENKDITFGLSIKGTVGNQEAFQAELRNWILNKHQNEVTVCNKEANDIEDSTNESNCLVNNIPKKKYKVLRLLHFAFASLKKDLGNPKDLYKNLIFLKEQRLKMINEKVISPKQLSNNRDNMNSVLRKLNMILLGQAGLADGTKHLNELYSLHEKLTNYRQKQLPVSLREEIGEHYHCVFTAVAREDYKDLVSKFYKINQVPQFKPQNYERILKYPKLNHQKALNVVESAQKNTRNENKKLNETEATRNKLVFYQRRLLNFKPNDSILKKKREALVRKLFFTIGLINKMNEISSKTLRKMKKIQEQAKQFLIQA